jgi:SAM-dependent methyltransferase
MRIAAKTVLSRLPVSYDVWRRLSLFRHGEMDNAGYAWASFHRHFDRCVALGLGTPFVGLELGPGDSLASALIARVHGATHTFLVDAGVYASADVAIYDSLQRDLVAKGKTAETNATYSSIGDFLTRNMATYLTRGVESLRALADSSVDFIWSEAVLEHIRLRDFDEMMWQSRRVLRPNGLVSHRVDLQDHLGGSLNNLRFSQDTWESDFMARSGFYTNRIRFSDMMNRFRACGFEVRSLATDAWSSVPLSRRSMAAQFQALDDDELRVSGFDVVLQAV